MGATAVKPWHFTIVFDEDKALKNGYDVKLLYDYVGENVEPCGMERIGNNTWQPRDGRDEVIAQCSALSKLSKTERVMRNIKSLVFFEGDNDPIDFIIETKEMHPERVFC